MCMCIYIFIHTYWPWNLTSICYGDYTGGSNEWHILASEDGIHYDALALAAEKSAAESDDITMFQTGAAWWGLALKMEKMQPKGSKKLPSYYLKDVQSTGKLASSLELTAIALWCLQRRDFSARGVSSQVFYLPIWVCLKTRDCFKPPKNGQVVQETLMFWGFFQLDPHPYFQESFKINIWLRVLSIGSFHFRSDYYSCLTYTPPGWDLPTPYVAGRAQATQPGAIAELVDSKARVLVEEQHQQRQWLGPVVATGGSLKLDPYWEGSNDKQSRDHWNIHFAIILGWDQTIQYIW